MLDSQKERRREYDINKQINSTLTPYRITTITTSARDMRNFFAITSSESIHRIKPAAVCSTTAPLPQAFQHFNRLLAEESPHKPFKPKALSTQPLENDYEVPKSTHHRAFQNQGSTWLLKHLPLSKSNYTQGTAIAAKLVPIDPNPLKSHVLLVPPSFIRYCALTW